MAKSKLKGRDFLRALFAGMRTYGELMQQKQLAEEKAAPEKMVQDFIAERLANPENVQSGFMFGKTGMPTGIAVESGLYRKQQASDKQLIDRYKILGITPPKWLTDRSELQVMPTRETTPAELLEHRAKTAGQQTDITKAGIFAGLPPDQQKIAAFPTLKPSEPVEWATKLRFLGKYAQTKPKNAVEQAEYDWATGKSDIKPVGTAEVNLVIDEFEKFFGKIGVEGSEAMGLSSEELVAELNALGRRRYADRWVDFVAPIGKPGVKRGSGLLEWLSKDIPASRPTFVPQTVAPDTSAIRSQVRALMPDATEEEIEEALKGQ